jgi:hypothetical protein
MSVCLILNTELSEGPDVGLPLDYARLFTERSVFAVRSRIHRIGDLV